MTPLRPLNGAGRPIRSVGAEAPLKIAGVLSDQITVTTEVVVLSFGAGGAMLAVWIDVRFPRLAPKALRGVLLHVIGACGVCLATEMLVDVGANDAAWRRIGTVFAVDLPVLVYMFIASLWVLKMVRDAAGSPGGGGGHRVPLR